MFCLVDFRNRPQFEYTFRSRDEAREYLKKIRNNPLGVTAVYSDGRREYFENGLPEMFCIKKKANLPDRQNNFQILKGCHAKYKIQKLKTLDGLLKTKNENDNASFSNWKDEAALSLFMIGNRKIYAGLAIITLFVFSSSFYFQNHYGKNAPALAKIDEASFKGQIAGAFDTNETDDEDSLQLADDEVVMNLLGKIEEEKQEEFEKEILNYIKGRPMEKMAPYISKQPRIVAAFIVGIAMKESKFGVYAPRGSSGQDCFNYWGYRGQENTTASGYSCFNSPEHAIQVVGKKITNLTAQGISNPAEMISWKCGSSCPGHGDENVRKWISDVGIYFSKINS